MTRQGALKETVMIRTKACLLIAAVLACCASTRALAETPEEWVKLGARVHGAFGSFIPVGIRIGRLPSLIGSH